MIWSKDSFAYAESYDEAASRYRGLRCGQLVPLSLDNLGGLLVKPEPALRQQEMEMARSTSDEVVTEIAPTGTRGEVPATCGPGERPSDSQPGTALPKRFHGSVSLDATRVGRDASRVADEVISHLSGLTGATVRVTLEIEAEIPNGTPDRVVRTVTENSRTLKFGSQGFEQE